MDDQQRLVLQVERIAHGGHCVARHDGQVVFVRHALPGETVEALVTGSGPRGRFLRADAVTILQPSADRVAPPCALAGPGGCGGCDFQHVSLPAQRRLKSQVVTEQLQRLAGIAREVEVEELPGAPDGLRWRTRVRLAVDASGRPGFREHRSHRVVPAPDCPLVHPEVTATGALAQPRPGAAEVVVAAAAGDGTVVLVDGRPEGASRLTETVGDRRYRVSGAGFWQVHPAAAAVLSDVVMTALAPVPGERIADLYAGVGLFAAPLAEAVGRDGEVIAVESDAAACRDARRNLHDLPQVRIVADRVDRWLRSEPGPLHAVVLDPPRSGAGRAVIAEIDRALGPQGRLCYVACDPAALARDLADLIARGWALEGLRAFDAFPMTHHVECVAWLRRTGDRAPA